MQTMKGAVARPMQLQTDTIPAELAAVGLVLVQLL